MREEHQNNHFMKGLLLGGVAAGITALLVAPKSGKELYNDIKDTYNDVAEKTEELKHKGWHLLHPNERCEQCESPTHFLTGAGLGAILGVTSALLLAPKPGSKLRNDIGNALNTVVDQGEELKDTATNFIENLQSTFNKKNSALHNVFELANTGIQMWQNFHKRK